MFTHVLSSLGLIIFYQGHAAAQVGPSGATAVHLGDALGLTKGLHALGATDLRRATLVSDGTLHLVDICADPGE